jgi:hypothetical protein
VAQVGAEMIVTGDGKIFDSDQGELPCGISFCVAQNRRRRRCFFAIFETILAILEFTQKWRSDILLAIN